MKTFNYDRYQNMTGSNETLNLIKEIYYLKGKLDYIMEKESKRFERLRNFAFTDDVYASNKIESIVVADNIFEGLMKESKIPVTYSERQIMGYKLVLQDLRDSDGADEIDSNFILDIHYKLFKFTTSHWF